MIQITLSDSEDEYSQPIDSQQYTSSSGLVPLNNTNARGSNQLNQSIAASNSIRGSNQSNQTIRGSNQPVMYSNIPSRIPRSRGSSAPARPRGTSHQSSINQSIMARGQMYSPREIQYSHHNIPKSAHDINLHQNLP